MNLVILALVLNVFSSIRCANDFCRDADENSCEENRRNEENFQDLDEKYEEIYAKIKAAEEAYVPCDRRNCRCYDDAMAKDLKPFEKGIDAEAIEIAKTRGILYQSISGRLYREKDCMFPARCSGIEHFVAKVAKNLSRDTEFVVNVRDYPRSGVHFESALPIFSFSKTADYYDVMYPAWSFWEGGPAISLYPQGLGRWDRHRKMLNESSGEYAWERKLDKAFFRGSRTSTERDNLVLLSRRNPRLVDAAYTKNQAWKSNEDTLNAAPASEVSLRDHCRYKYLFNYRGVAASFRHKHLFLCGSVVFHVGDEWKEFYYDSMRPWIHFIPVDKNAGQMELENLINFAKDNQSLSKRIADRGKDFIWKKLRMKDVKCYWRKLLGKYSELLTYEPKLRSNLILVD